MLIKRHVISVLMVLAFGFTSAITPAVSIAGPIPSSVGAQTSRAADVDRIEEALGDPAVLEALRQAGTDADALRGRLGQLSDHEVHQLSQRMHAVKAGGLSVEGLLVLVLLVLLIIYLWNRI